MSHKVTLKTKIKNIDAFKRALEKAGIVYHENKVVRFYNTRAKGLAFQLPGWKYAAVVTADGKIQYDNYNGSWGRQEELTKVITGYAREIAQEQAWAMGWQVTEEVVNGKTVITLSEGGSW